MCHRIAVPLSAAIYRLPSIPALLSRLFALRPLHIPVPIFPLAAGVGCRAESWPGAASMDHEILAPTWLLVGEAEPDDHKVGRT